MGDWLKSSAFVRQRDLGQGAAATVVCVSDGNRKLALKRARPKFVAASEDRPYWASPIAFFEDGIGPWELEPQRALEAEVGLLASLEHPAFVKLAPENADASDGTAIMEFIDGQCWRDLIGNEALGWTQLLELVDALSSSQLKFHGDLKPDNLMLDSEGRVRIVDPSSGVAELQDGRPHSLLTTNLYNPVLAASDVPALGVLIAEVMLGNHPFAEAQDDHPMTPDLEEAVEWMCNMGFGEATENYRSMILSPKAPAWQTVSLRCLGMKLSDPKRADSKLDVEDAFRSVTEVTAAMKEIEL